MRILLILLVFSLLAVPLSRAQDSADDQSLIEAVYASDDQWVESLLAAGVNPNYHDKGDEGWTGLIIAAYNGNRKIVELLLEAGADPNLGNNWNSSPLYWTTSADHAEIVALLLAAGARPNHQDDFGSSALMRASTDGLTPIAKLLLDAGADPYLVDNEGNSAFRYAIRNGHSEIIPLFLAVDIDIDRKILRWGEASRLAQMQGQEEIVTIIEAALKEPEILNRGLVNAVVQNRYILATRLLGDGADPDARDSGGITALQHAVESGRADIITQLLESGANPDPEVPSGATPLILASQSGAVEIVTLLLASGALPDRQDEQGATAFLHAAAQGHTEVLALLLDAGAEPNYQDSRGRSALHWATFEWLLANGADPDLLDEGGQVAAQITIPEIFTDHPARVVTNINGLNVRRTPAIESDNIVGRLQPGQQVHVLAREGDWQQVRSEEGHFGWAHSDYLIDLPPRELGETRAFRILSGPRLRPVVVNAELRYKGAHSYIYAIENEGGPPISADKLRQLGEDFDERVYPEIISLWQAEPRPSYEGDERIVILISHGFGGQIGVDGYYHSRADMLGEVNPYNNRVGFIEIRWVNSITRFRSRTTAAHEFGHLIHLHVDRNERSWLDEGLAVYSQLQAGDPEDPEGFASAFFNNVGRVQLNPSEMREDTYGASFLFLTYLQDRFGLETLQDFATHPENGLAALDSVFAELGADVDADTFFADWALANYLNNTQFADGRYGYPMLSKINRNAQPYAIFFRNLPAIFEQREPQYSTRYFKYELPPEVFTRQLELDLRLDGTASHDAWLHFVQFTGSRIDIDRFRYRDFRGQPVMATLHEGTVHAFLTVSPFNPDNRVNEQPVRYTLSIRTLVSQEAAIAADPSDLSPSDLTLSIESLDPADYTDLMRAVSRGDVLAVNRIFIESANSIPPMEMLLSFHLAAAAGYEDVVALFTLTDIDIQAQDAKGQTALSLAEEAGHDRVAALLRAVTAEGDRRAPQRMAQEEIRDFLLFARDGDPDTRARTLTEAAKSGFTNLLHLLLTSRDLDLDIDLIDVYGETALMAALRAGHTDTVARLLALGADTDPQQESGRFTALIYASILSDQEIIEQLLAAGADVNYRGGNGWNALGWAVVEGNVAAVEQLIAAGVISSGMLPKVEACVTALKRGVKKTHIIDGRISHAILLEVFTSEGIGTEIIASDQETTGH